MELLRSLFTLATSTSKSIISALTIATGGVVAGASSVIGGGTMGAASVVGAGAGSGVGPQARQAVLQIAGDTRSGGGTLFMTTLSLDILHPKDLEHRRSVMQLVAFLIRKVCTAVFHLFV